MADDGSPSGPKLLQQAEKILLHPIHPHLISYCPTMDLIAFVTDEENLDVYRINGQRAFGLKRKSADETVDAICWEFNGQAIAVAWSDGCTDIVSSETGKVIHKDVPPPTPTGTDGVEEQGDVRIKCIGWGLNFIDVEAVKRRTGLKRRKKRDEMSGATIDFSAPTTEDWDAFKDDTSLEDFLQRQPDFQTLDIAPDLPDQLAMLDVESLFPKLPPIPLPPANPFMMRAAQADTGAFSSQAQVDGLLHSQHTKDHNSVDMFVRCTQKGTVHPSIYDSLETVDVQLPKAWELNSRPIMHASHPYSCTHGMLMETKAATWEKKKLAFVPLTLGFIPSAGIYLHLIASKTAQLQNLLAYITQTLQRIRAFFTHSQDLPSKFMRNINETLEEHHHPHGDLVTNLFHLACTGNCPPLIRDWLVDELAEQGHKRWDNAVTAGLATVVQLLHENLLPALDRCAIIISRLRGLAEYHEQGWIFSGPVSDFTALLELLKNLRLLAHTTMLYAADEKRQFAAFSKWLRFCIDFEATEPDSQSRAEMEARDPGVDVPMVLEYIRYGLTKSDLGPYLRAQKDVNGKSKEAASYVDTVKAIELLKEGGAYKEEALCLERVLSLFGDGVHSLLKQVSQWQENSIRMDSGIVLEEGDFGASAAVDMRMVFEPATTTTEDAISTYIALAPPTANPSSPAPTLTIHRLTHAPTVTSLPFSLHSLATTTISFPSSTSAFKILDAAFADDTSLLILLQSNSTNSASTPQPSYSLLSLLYRSSGAQTPPPPTTTTTTTTTPPFRYTPLDPSTHPSLLLPSGAPTPDSTRAKVTLTPDQIRKYTRHVFERRFTPLKLMVNGRKGRRVVVVLGSDRKHYRVLDLDFREGGKKKAEGTGRRMEAGDGKEEQGSESSSEESDVEMGGE